MKFDLLTVVCSRDLLLLKTQAESINLYIDPDTINNIIVVVNEPQDLQINPQWYGNNSNKLVIKKRNDYPNVGNISGWDSQQIYKLLASSESTVDWVMTLDAKTWFINKFNCNEFFKNNRAHTGAIPANTHFQQAKKFVENLFNINFKMLLGPGGVPFFFNSHIVRNLINDIERLTNSKFVDFFINNLVDKTTWESNISEFYLYSGYVLYKFNEYDNFYSNKSLYNAVNLADWHVNEFSYFINIIQSSNSLTSSIHPNAYKLLSQEQKDLWHAFLRSKGLDNIQYS